MPFGADHALPRAPVLSIAFAPNSPGCDAYLTKPTRMQEFLNTLREFAIAGNCRARERAPPPQCHPATLPPGAPFNPIRLLVPYLAQYKARIAVAMTCPCCWPRSHT